MDRVFWLAIHKALLALAGADDSFLTEIRRGWLMIVRGGTVGEFRNGLHMLAGTIQRKYDPEAYQTKQAQRQSVKAEARQSRTHVLQ